ncbi:Conserved_hypothetical protein [Hexamita inflata]|uniref:MORN repeat protein n=1 Tax=Hexamita inflata TaxID=28002 RepID=A0AA86UXM4_9EUKA|nr:Conserved hypothetical protein [Hexamita inflata]
MQLQQIKTKLKNGILNSDSIIIGKQNQYYGEGKIIWENESQIQFKFDQTQSGSAQYDFKNGDKYNGNIKNGKISGVGTYTWNNGQKFEGNFKNGQINGKGTLTQINGTKISGQWNNGSIILKKNTKEKLINTIKKIDEFMTEQMEFHRFRSIIIIILTLIIGITAGIALHTVCDTCTIPITKKYKGNIFKGQQLQVSKRILLGELTYKNGKKYLIYDIKCTYKNSLIEQLLKLENYNEDLLNSEDLNHILDLSPFLSQNIKLSSKLYYSKNNCTSDNETICQQFWGWWQKQGFQLNKNELNPYFGVVIYGNINIPYFKYIGRIKVIDGEMIPQEFGQIFFLSGSNYQGQILDGNIQGFGQYISQNGKIYNGTWQNNQFIKGSITSSSKTKQNTTWSQSNQTDSGYDLGILQRNGDYYEGYLYNNKYHGEGILNYKNGSNYTGNFSNGHCNGEGFLELSNGDYYTGNWKNNQKSGYGIYSFSGNKYIGDFSEDLAHGRGSVLYQNYDHYDGYWSEGNYHGHGTLIQYNGDSYTGNFKNGEYHGNGKLTTIDGVVKNGEWRNGTFVRGEITQINGAMLFYDEKDEL